MTIARSALRPSRPFTGRNALPESRRSFRSWRFDGCFWTSGDRTSALDPLRPFNEPGRRLRSGRSPPRIFALDRFPGAAPVGSARSSPYSVSSRVTLIRFDFPLKPMPGRSGMTI